MARQYILHAETRSEDLWQFIELKKNELKLRAYVKNKTQHAKNSANSFPITIQESRKEEELSK